MIGIHLKLGHTRAPLCSQDKLLLGFPQPGGCFRGTHARVCTLGTPSVSLVGPCTVNSVSAWPSRVLHGQPLPPDNCSHSRPGHCTCRRGGGGRACAGHGADTQAPSKASLEQQGLPPDLQGPPQRLIHPHFLLKVDPTPTPDLGASSSVGAQASTPTPAAVSCGQRGGSEIHLPSSAS